MQPTQQMKFGQASWRIASREVEAFVTETGGHLGPVTFRLGKRKIQPFAIAPWAALVAANGPAALFHHSEFKNRDNAFNAAAWLASDNTFVVIVAAAAAYMALNYSSSSEGGGGGSHAVTVTAIVACAFVVLALDVLVARRRSIQPYEQQPAKEKEKEAAFYKLLAVALLALPAMVVVHAVGCITSRASGRCREEGVGGCTITAYTATVVVVVLVFVSILGGGPSAS